MFPGHKLIIGKAKCFCSVVWQMNALFLILFLSFRRFFDRDVNCICDFFKRRFGYESSLHPAFSDVMYVTLQPNSYLQFIGLCLNFYWCFHVLVCHLFAASLSLQWISAHNSVVPFFVIWVSREEGSWSWLEYYKENWFRREMCLLWEQFTEPKLLGGYATRYTTIVMYKWINLCIIIFVHMPCSHRKSPVFQMCCFRTNCS